jgi:hypothetical protein
MAASLGDARRDVLLLGTRPQRIDDVEVLPLARFLEAAGIREVCEV